MSGLPTLLTTITFFAVLAITADVKAEQIITFDAPNSGTGASQGTLSAGINLFGTITGSITGSNDGTHGFVRTRDGAITGFDVPGAGPVTGCTCPVAINGI